ncbi:hypothetical protein ACHAXA_002151 [Cyclostephanos tholiformis]|uniref:Ribosomal protein L9 domain-containing protein n=1 Tax=Cyclostephanos tholiformis TaxID=382380 RepID=A0ABD3R3N1_9STRA
MASALSLSGMMSCGRRGRLASFSVITRKHQPQLPQWPQKLQHQQQLRHKHQVRVIVTRDLPEGQMRGVYAGEVHNVSAGYARNYLVPKKYAVYATTRNFERCGLVDPAIAAREEEKQAAASALLTAVDDDDDEEGNEDLRAADVLRRYLRNKSLRIVRNVDPNMPVMCHPGHVNARNLREKLSRQLKIDLEEHEKIHIRNEPVVGLEEKGEAELMKLLEEMMDGGKEKKGPAKEGADAVEARGGGSTDPADQSSVESAISSVNGEEDLLKDCDVKVKQLGDYVAKITLRGGYVVPLKFTVVRR